jgi:negative regulator of PHO system
MVRNKRGLQWLMELQATPALLKKLDAALCKAIKNGKKTKGCSSFEVNDVTVLLNWRSEASYNAVQSWLSVALANLGLDWTLKLTCAQLSTPPSTPAPSGSGRQDTGHTEAAAIQTSTVEIDASPAPPSWFWLRVLLLRERSSTEVGNEFISQYSVGDVIGEGSFGVVRSGLRLCDNRPVAIKEYDDWGNSGRGSAHWELSLYDVLRHSNIIRLFDVWPLGKSLRLVFDHGGASLLIELRRNGAFPMEKSKVCVRAIGSAIAYLHSMDVIHNDLKTANVLIDAVGGVKVADLGAAIVGRNWEKPVQIQSILQEGVLEVTLWYRPLEILLGEHPYSRKVDTWGCGCIMAEMALGKPLFSKAAHATEMILAILQRCGHPMGGDVEYLQKLPLWSVNFPVFPGRDLVNSEQCFRDVYGTVGCELLGQMLSVSPVSRIDAQGVVEHPFLATLVAPPPSKKARF